MKHTFAQYYHELIYDESVYHSYFSWVKRESKAKHILECACGPGHLSYLLGQDGFVVDALDLDSSMIDYANSYNKLDSINYYHQTMFDLSSFNQYDTIIIFLDSLNYCKDLDELRHFFNEAYSHLKVDGIILFDLHHPNRLDEFYDEYIEEGILLGNHYQWSIQTIEGKKLHHNIVIYEDDQMQINTIEQTVFSVEEIESILNEFSFNFERVLKFDESEFDLDEKLYYRARKG